MPCSECGSKSRHRKVCSKAGLSRDVSSAVEWFGRFGDDRSCISENGAKFFRVLLDEIDRLRKRRPK